MNEVPVPPDKASPEKQKAIEKLISERHKTQAALSLFATLTGLRKSGKSEKEILGVLKDIFKKK